MTNNMSTRRIHQPVTFPLYAVRISVYQCNWILQYSAAGTLGYFANYFAVYPSDITAQRYRIMIPRNSRCTRVHLVADAPLCDRIFFSASRCICIILRAYHCNAYRYPRIVRRIVDSNRIAYKCWDLSLHVYIIHVHQLKGSVEGRRIYLAYF